MPFNSKTAPCTDSWQVGVVVEVHEDCIVEPQPFWWLSLEVVVVD